MNKSTGGRVLRDRTSVNDGSLFLRLSAYSSWRWRSSSIAVVVGLVVVVVNGEQPNLAVFGPSSRPPRDRTARRSGRFRRCVQRCARPPRHVVRQGSFASYQGDPYSLLPDRCCVGRHSVSRIHPLDLPRPTHRLDVCSPRVPQTVYRGFIPCDEGAQPRPSYSHPRGERNTSESVRAFRCVSLPALFCL